MTLLSTNAFFFFFFFFFLINQLNMQTAIIVSVSQVCSRYQKKNHFRISDESFSIYQYRYKCYFYIKIVLQLDVKKNTSPLKCLSFYLKRASKNVSAPRSVPSLLSFSSIIDLTLLQSFNEVKTTGTNRSFYKCFDNFYDSTHKNKSSTFRFRITCDKSAVNLHESGE